MSARNVLQQGRQRKRSWKVCFKGKIFYPLDSLVFSDVCLVDCLKYDYRPDPDNEKYSRQSCFNAGEAGSKDT